MGFAVDSELVVLEGHGEDVERGLVLVAVEDVVEGHFIVSAEIGVVLTLQA